MLRQDVGHAQRSHGTVHVCEERDGAGLAEVALDVRDVAAHLGHAGKLRARARSNKRFIVVSSMMFLE